MRSARTLARATSAFSLMAVAAIGLLIISGPLTGQPLLIDSVAPQLYVQFGATGGAALGIINALDSPWAAALSIALVPLGLGTAGLAIRATWTTLLATMGRAAAKEAIKRF